jgi:hypothetical protein
VVSFTSRPLYPPDRRLAGPKAGLNTAAYIQVLCLCRELNHRPPGQPVSHYISLPSYRLSYIQCCQGVKPHKSNVISPCSSHPSSANSHNTLLIHPPPPPWIGQPAVHEGALLGQIYPKRTPGPVEMMRRFANSDISRRACVLLK